MTEQQEKELRENIEEQEQKNENTYLNFHIN